MTILYHQIFIFFTALFFAGGILFFLRGKDTWLKIMLISPLVGAYLLFFFISTKEHKTTVPYLVFFALITSTGLLAVRITALRRVIIGLVIAIGILQYFDVSYWNGALTVRPLRQFLQVPLPAPLSVTESFTPTGGNWKVNEVAEELDAVVARIGMRRGEPVYFALSDKFYYGFRSDNYYVTNLWPVAYFYWLKKNGEHPRVEPVSLRTGDWKDGIEMLILSEELAHSRCPEDERRNYRLVKQLSMPDNSPVFLYEREHDG